MLIVNGFEPRDFQNPSLLLYGNAGFREKDVSSLYMVVSGSNLHNRIQVKTVHGPLKCWYPTIIQHGLTTWKTKTWKLHRREDLKTRKSRTIYFWYIRNQNRCKLCPNIQKESEKIQYIESCNIG